MRSSLQTGFSIGIAALALGTVSFGTFTLFKSPLFTVRFIEVNNTLQKGRPPVDTETLTALSGVPLGKVSLFRLSLKSVEEKMLKHPWVQAVRLEKKFPETLLITVTFRDPKALFQAENGSLSYIDSRGHVFGKLNLNTLPNLPLFSGMPAQSPSRIQDALHLLQKWDEQELNRLTQMTAMHFDTERGYQALVTYSLQGRKQARAFVHLGTEFDTPEFQVQLSRLKQVFKYLTDRGIDARQIWADVGKKIIVKIGPNS